MWFRPIAGDRVPVAFEPLGLGEPVGAGFVRSINQSQRETHANAYVAYLGDPTLRLQVLAPPAELRNVSAEQAAIEWDRSPETNALYFVYRSSNHLDGPWQRVTDVPLTGTNFVDLAAPPGPKLYQVRAAKLTATGSGSFTNLSQGVFIEVD